MKKRREGYKGLNVVFNTTEDCNLRCTYCYEINKTKKTLSLEHAKKFIDMLLDDPKPIGNDPETDNIVENNGLILDFLGGDSLMDVELIRQILYYFMWTANLKNHRWANRWRASISSNGTLLNRPDVIEFLEEFNGSISLGISVDGCPEIHDKYRVFPDGSGSSSEILSQWPWYEDYCRRSGQNTMTKATLAKDSIPYLYDSLVYLHETLGLKEIDMNFIMEDMGLTKEDCKIFDEQMKLCVEYVLERSDDIYWAMLDKEKIGEPFDEESKLVRRCGSGAMPTLGIDGNIYPCFRWLPHTVTKIPNLEKFILGNVSDGKFINKEGFQEVRDATVWKVSDDECRKCEVQSACPFCIAGCYSEFHEFKRTKYICELTKINSKWAKYYWDKIEEL